MKRLLRFASLVLAASVAVILSSLALSQVPASFIRSGFLPSGTVAQGSGSFVLLEQHAASASSTLDFTTCISSTYDQYEIDYVNLVTSTPTQVGLRMSTNGGSTYDTGNNYNFWFNYAYYNGSGREGADNTDGIYDRELTTDLQASGSINASYKLFNPASTTLYKPFLYSISGYDSGLYLIVSNGAALYKSNTAVNAFRVFTTAGNLTSGTVRCYGLAK